MRIAAHTHKAKTEKGRFQKPGKFKYYPGRLITPQIAGYVL